MNWLKRDGCISKEMNKKQTEEQVNEQQEEEEVWTEKRKRLNNIHLFNNTNTHRAYKAYKAHKAYTIGSIWESTYGRNHYHASVFVYAYQNSFIKRRTKSAGWLCVDYVGILTAVHTHHIAISALFHNV